MIKKISKSLARRPVRIFAIILVISIPLLFLTLFVSKDVMSKQRQDEIQKFEEKINQYTVIINTLNKIVETQSAFEEATGGGNIMPLSIMSVDKVDYTASEQKTWEKCYSGLESLNKALPNLREDAALINGDDADIYNSWVTNAEKIGQWSVCYKSFIYANADKIKDSDDNMINISDRISGRLKVLEAEQKKEKDNLSSLSSEKYFLWW